MAKAYLIANVEVQNQALYDEYRKHVGAVITKFGGKLLVRGGALDRLEHAESFHRVIVLEFPTVETARHFYHSPEYKPLLDMRLKATHTQLVIAEGADTA